LADDPERRRAIAVGGYTTTAVLSELIGAATAVWQVAALRAGAWTARGAGAGRNALLQLAAWPGCCGPERRHGWRSAT
jgi:hypothetical protein